VDISESNFNSQYGKLALRKLFDHIFQESEELPEGVWMQTLLENTDTTKYSVREFDFLDLSRG